MTVKVAICGEVMEYEPEREYTVEEAEAIEDALDLPYTMWLNQLISGRAKAFTGLAWVTLRRNGRDIPFADLRSGAAGFSLAQFIIDVVAATEPDEDEPDPTGGAETPSTPDGSRPAAPAGTVTTSNGTNRSSPKSTASGRGKQGS